MRVAETELTAVVSMTGHVSEAHSLVARLLQMRNSASFQAHFCNQKQEDHRRGLRNLCWFRKIMKVVPAVGSFCFSEQSLLPCAKLAAHFVRDQDVEEAILSLQQECSPSYASTLRLFFLNGCYKYIFQIVSFMVGTPCARKHHIM